MRKKITAFNIITFIFASLCLIRVVVADEVSKGVDAPSVSGAQAAKTPEAWQVREAQYFKIIEGVRRGDAVSQMALDRVLTEFETSRMTRTPIENLDILGTFYIPKEGVEKALPIVVMNEVLGWYDALRFGTESGRAEILQNESFYKRPFVLAGPASIQQIISLLRDHPDEVAADVHEGIMFAENHKSRHDYDAHWPSAFGLERTICAQGGKCTPPESLPEEQWPAAWSAAENRVLAYYKTTK